MAQPTIPRPTPPQQRGAPQNAPLFPANRPPRNPTRNPRHHSRQSGNPRTAAPRNGRNGLTPRFQFPQPFPQPANFVLRRLLRRLGRSPRRRFYLLRRLGRLLRRLRHLPRRRLRF